MSTDDRTCPSCGARVSAGATRCDLCGTSLEEAEPPEEDEAPASETSPESSAEPSEGPEDEPSVFCNQCGWENPPGAQYCSRCGEALQDLSEAAPAGTQRVRADLPTGGASDQETDKEDGASREGKEAAEQAAVGRQIVFVVGGALFLVLGLFFATQWSNQYEWGGGSSGSSTARSEAGGRSGSASRSSGARRPGGTRGKQGQSTPMDLQTLLDQTADSLTGPVAGQIDSLRVRIEQASGGKKRQLQGKLVNLLIGAGHPGRAAVVQKKLAEATGTVEAQRRTADLLYRWMQKMQSQGRRRKVFQVARHAAQAYEKVAKRRPEDLDARTRMGEAYLLTNEPMKGIKAINAVLDDDSTFVPARFQKGLALLQINRLDQAVKQFNKVKQYAEKGSPFYQQAEQALKVIKQQRTQSASGTTTSGAGP